MDYRHGEEIFLEKDKNLLKMVIDEKRTSLKEGRNEERSQTAWMKFVLLVGQNKQWEIVIDIFSLLYDIL